MTLTTTVRPNSDGSTIECTKSAGSYNYENIDEVSIDTSNYNLATTTSYKTDVFDFTNPTPSGLINSVTVYTVYSISIGSYTAYCKEAIQIGANLYYGTENSYTGSGNETDSHTWSTNPSTGVAWTWNDINSLQFGYSIKTSSATVTSARAYQCYAVISYELPIMGLGLVGSGLCGNFSLVERGALI